jgi:regulator of protease activity HflC (stomatin/prohibitin superfamily)
MSTVDYPVRRVPAPLAVDMSTPPHFVPQPVPQDRASVFTTGGAQCAYFILVCIGLFLLIVLLPLSFGYITYSEVGMMRDIYGTTNTQTILTRGRHYIHPGLQELVKFDATYQQVSFLESNGQSLSVYANNGLQFSVDATFYYKINPETLSQTYTQYNLGYPSQVQNIAPSIIKNSAPTFTVLEYANNRVAVQNYIGEALAQVLANEVYVTANPTFFTITNVFYPNTTLQANLDSALSIQQNALSQSQQTLQLIVQQTSVDVEQILVQANITLAKAEADANVIVQNSLSQAQAIVLSANGLGIQYASSLLGLSNEDGSLTEFVQLVAMQQATAPHVVWGIGAGKAPVYTLSV